MLVRWNKRLNLTAIREETAIVERHYCESLFLGVHLPEGQLRIADVGSGAGFPGVPVAVLRPDCAVTLIESHQRKAVFLRESTRGLANVRVSCQRAEEVEDEFDWAISRAVDCGEIDTALRKLAGNVALLGSEAEPTLTGFTWQSPIQLPWGRHRHLWVGKQTRFT